MVPDRRNVRTHPQRCTKYRVTQPFACLPNHVVGKGVIKELRSSYPEANIVAIDFDPGASEVNQLNRIKLMLSTAKKNLNKDDKKEHNKKCRLQTSFSQKTNSKLHSRRIPAGCAALLFQI